MNHSPSPRLSLLVFPHAWDGQRLRGSVLLLPTGDPLHAPLFKLGAPFASLRLTIRLVLTPDDSTRRDVPISSLGHSVVATTIQRQASADTKRLFEALHAQFLPTPQASNARALAHQQRKRSARMQALGAVERRFPRIDLKTTLAPKKMAHRELGEHHASTPHCRHVSWGQALSHALRQPALARALGLVVDFELDFAALGLAAAQPAWLHASLDNTGMGESADSAPAEGVVSYAALLPPLDGRVRSLFAAVHFPLHAPLIGPEADALFSEAAAYNEGFARSVLASQAPGADPGITLTWDDEQVLRWVNRQLDPNRTANASGETVDVHAPVGVAGYRVDARLHRRQRRQNGVRNGPHNNRAAWHSLCGARANLAVDVWHTQFKGELWVDVAPHAAHQPAGEAWHLPSYFAVWRGGSLVLPDPAQQSLNGSPADNSTWAALPLPERRALPALRYGQQWDFRVRMVDLSGGGPQLDDVSEDATPTSVATLRFLRHAPPRPLRIETLENTSASPTSPPDSLFIRRPLLAYPDFGFAGVDATPALLEQLKHHRSAPRSLQHGLGVSDPDVTHVAVAVQVRAPFGDSDVDSDSDSDSDGDGDGDTDLAEKAQTVARLLRDGDHIELFSVLIPLPPRSGFAVNSLHFDEDEAALGLRLAYTDCADVQAGAAALQAASIDGVLMLPTGRDVRLRCRAACLLKKGKRHHFADALIHTIAAQCVALGSVADLSRRCEELTALELLASEEPTQTQTQRHTTALWLQASAWPPAAACAEPLQALAAAVGLHADGMRLRAQPGSRVLLAASGRMGHVVEHGGSQIRFNSTHDMTGRWVVAHRVCLQRDWTWSGLMEPGIAIEAMPNLPGQPTRTLGTVSLPFAVSRVAAQSRTPQRSHTTFIFFDTTEAIHVETLNELDDETVVQKHVWQARTRLSVPAEVLTELHALRLPFARRPRHVPRVVAMGVLSRSAGTGAAPTLWIEFERALSVQAAHPIRGLKYFARWCHSEGEGPQSTLTAGTAECIREWTEISASSFDRHANISAADLMTGMTELMPSLPTIAHTAPKHADGTAPIYEVSRWLLPLPDRSTTHALPALPAKILELCTGLGSAHWTTPNARFSHVARVHVHHFF